MFKQKKLYYEDILQEHMNQITCIFQQYQSVQQYEMYENYPYQQSLLEQKTYLNDSLEYRLSSASSYIINKPELIMRLQNQLQQNKLLDLNSNVKQQSYQKLFKQSQKNQSTQLNPKQSMLTHEYQNKNSNYVNKRQHIQTDQLPSQIFKKHKKMQQNNTFSHIFKLILWIFCLIEIQHKHLMNVSATIDTNFVIWPNSWMYYFQISSDYKTVFAFFTQKIRIYNFIDSNLTLKQEISTYDMQDNKDHIQIWNDGVKIFIVARDSNSRKYVINYQFNATSDTYYTNQNLKAVDLGSTYTIHTIQVNTKGDLLLVGISQFLEGFRIRRYLSLSGLGWALSDQYLVQREQYQTLILQFARQDTKLLIFDTYYNKIQIWQLNNQTFSPVLSFSLNVNWTSGRPQRCKLSKDQNFVTCYYSEFSNSMGYQYNNYQINWQNNTYLSVVKQPDNSSYRGVNDVYMDINKIYTIIDYDNKTVIRYQLNVSGSSFQYTLLDSGILPVSPQYMVSQSQSKFQIVYTSNSSIYLVKYSCNNLPKCISCQKGNNTKCIFCSQQYLLENGTCSTCAPGYYQNGTICSKCSINFCKTCSSTTCSECLTGYILSNNSCSSCSIGYYRINNMCIKCPYECYNCTSGALTTCITCNIRYYNSSNKCLYCGINCLKCSGPSACIICDIGYFVSEGLCTMCIKGCSQCLNASSCSICSSGYVSLNNICCVIGTSVCHANGTSSSCSNGYYLLSQSCSPCLSNCLICSNSSSCTNCSVGWKSTSTEICNSCDLKYYLSGSSCLSCSINCDVCVNSTACLTCSLGSTLVNGLCCPPQTKVCNLNGTISSCNDGFYKVNNACQSCVSNCLTCQNPSRCIVCKTGYKIFTQLCDSCAIGYFKNQGICKPCILNCDDCNTNTSCLVCSKGYQGQLCKVCSTGYYNNIGGGVCSPCKSQCKTCQTLEKCTACAEGYKLAIDAPNSCGESINQCQSCKLSTLTIEADFVSSNMALIIALPSSVILAAIVLTILGKKGLLRPLTKYIFKNSQQQTIQEYISKLQFEHEKMKQNKQNVVVQHINENMKKGQYKDNQQQLTDNNFSSLQSLSSNRDSRLPSILNIFKNKLVNFKKEQFQ